MSTALLAVLAGLLAGLAVIAFVVAFRPVTPDLVDVLNRTYRPRASTAPAATGGDAERLGQWVLTHSHGLPGRTIPTADLDLLGITAARFATQKLTLFLIGLLLPAILALMAGLIGVDVAIQIPAVIGLILGCGGWMLPHLVVRREATAARDRFARTIVSYFSLVVMGRVGGAGVASAITDPAYLAEAPLFLRIRATLERQRLDRKTPWVALRELADQIELPQLRELADQLELAGTKSTSISGNLQARARDIRNEFLNRDVEAAGAASQRQVAFTALLLACFLAFIGAPSLLRLLGIA